MTRSFKFLYTDLQNFWMFVLLGFLFVWLWFFFFPCFLFQIPHRALFTLPLAITTLFVLRLFKQSAASASIGLCHLNVGVSLSCVVLSESHTLRHTHSYTLDSSQQLLRQNQMVAPTCSTLSPSFFNCKLFCPCCLTHYLIGRAWRNVMFSVNAFIHYSTSTTTKFLFVLLGKAHWLPPWEAVLGFRSSKVFFPSHAVLSH